ncbi:hypothetical protein QE152_g27508 [Popillia japonica]|uniref:Transposase n=1 Tax=Popillia japonica TaxID=7064 RepID=A0AAW1JVF8_POPJA
MPISGPIVKAKEEWLGKFKQRHINYGKISGEARSVDTNVTHGWINTVWSELTEKYAPSDIFNADEAGIFYKLTPDKTLKIKGEKCVGGQLSKERITVLVATNMDGTEKKACVRETEDQEQVDEDDETDEPEPTPGIKEALEAAKLLDKSFLYHQDASISQDMNKISKKVQDYWCSKRRQTK